MKDFANKNKVSLKGDFTHSTIYHKLSKNRLFSTQKQSVHENIESQIFKAFGIKTKRPYRETLFIQLHIKDKSKKGFYNQKQSVPNDLEI